MAAIRGLRVVHPLDGMRLHDSVGLPRSDVDGL